VDDIQCEKLDKSEFRCFVPTLTLTSGNTSSTIDPNIRVCQHKRLWPWSGKDIGGSLIIFFGGMLAAGAGVGGGGLFVPILILILEFTTKTAIPLSNTLILGSSIVNWLQIGMKRHPTANRPLIDYKLALLLQPLSVAGTIIGFLLNTVFPSWLILVLLVITLIITSVLTTRKGLNMRRKEHQQRMVLIPELNTPSPSSTPRLSDAEEPLGFNPDKTENGHGGAGVSSATSSINSLSFSGVELEDKSGPVDWSAQGMIDLMGNGPPPKLDVLLHKESKTNGVIVAIMFGLVFLMIAHALLIGGKASASLVGIQKCTAAYWGGYWAIFPVFVLVNVAVGYYLIRENNVKEQLGYPFQEGDIHWTPRTTLIISTICVVAGILSSLLGIGGGMVISPLLLQFNVLPEVTAATSSFMIMFTALAAVVQYIIAGRIVLDYGVYFATVGVVSSVLGQTTLTWFIRKYKKQSLLVFITAFIISASTVLLFISGLQTIITQFQAGVSMGFHSFC
jgi:uncharacterized membrane protein YfcA